MQTIPSNTLIHNRYFVLRQVGEGGQGAVYEAIDQRLDHRVALKQTLASDYELDKAFEREAKLLARLNHRALPRVTDYFQDGRGQFLVMDFIPGDNLAESLGRNGRFAVDYVLDWADQILDALQYLHQQEPPVLHRDIKPQNLKLNSNRQIILLDFGLAKGEVGLQSPISVGSSVRGYTRAYAPLEQVQGSGTDARSDLYALAATVYHLLAGQEPIDAVSRIAAAWGGKADPLRPIQQLNRNVPIPVAQVLMQALAISADQRPASATHMRQALRHARQPNLALAITPIAPDPQPAPRGWLLPATFISTLLLLLVALLLVVTRNPAPSGTESAIATVVESSPVAEAEAEAEGEAEDDTATKIVQAAATALSTPTTEPTQPAVGTGIVGVATTRTATPTPTPTYTPTPTPTPTQTPTPTWTSTPTPTPTPTLTPTPLPKIVEYRSSQDAVLFESMVGWGGEGGQTCYYLQIPLPSVAGRLQFPYANATIPVSQPQVEERDGNIYVTFEADSTEAQACGQRLYDGRVALDSQGVWVIKNAILISGPYPLHPDPNVAQGSWVINFELR